MLGILIVVVSVMAALISIPAGIYYLWDRNKATVSKTVGWRKVEYGVHETIRRLRSDNWVPDLVLAIGRSGAIYGGLIAGNMGNLPMAILDRHLAWDRTSREYVADHHSSIHLPDECKKVLVVVGEVYSGQSLTASVQRIKEAMQGRSIKTACLVHSNHSNVQVDYSVFEVDGAVRPAWILDRDYKRFDLLPKMDPQRTEDSAATPGSSAP
jgi:hypoxanthine phosphoribosyltransferase